MSTDATTSQETSLSAFALEEYKSLRAEILERIKETNTLIITAAGGIGGAYAVLVSTFAREPHLKFSHATGFVKFAFLIIVWTPAVFAWLAKLKSEEIWDTILKLAIYVRVMENIEFRSPSEIHGWENQMKRYRENADRWSDRICRPPCKVIYWFMVITTALFAVGTSSYIAKVSFWG